MVEGGDEALGIKDSVVFEHVINGAGEFDGQNGVGLEFIAAHAGFKPLSEGADEGVVAFGDDGGFGKGPAEIGVAKLLTAEPFDFAGGGDGAFDEAAIAEEILDGWEAGDVADFVKEGQAERFADAGDSLQESIVAVGMNFGEFFQLGIHGGDLSVIMANESELVLEVKLVNGVGFLGEEMFLPAVAVGGRRGGAVMSLLMGLNAGQELGTLPDEVEALAQQRPQRTLVGGIDVARRDEVGTEQVSEFFGVDAVIFVFAAVDGFEVKRVSEDEVDAGVGAGIGEPIPAEHALGDDGEVVAARGDELEEEVEVVVADVGVDEFFSGAVHDADIHLAGMEIDSAVEFSGRSVVFHEM